MKKFLNTIIVISIIGFISCKKAEPIVPIDENTRPKTIAEYNAVNEGLKDYFKDDYFEIGAAIEPSSIDNANSVTLMKRHFSSLTAENVMKWSTLQATEGNFNFAPADKIVNFATENGMKIRGHCLVWHQQIPDWVFKDGANTVSKTVLLDRMKTHITTVMNHFKGKVYAWDVVNEAIDDGSNIYKSTSWYNICGEDFIIEAFRAARAADPDAKLFYNDYSETQPAKRDKIYNLVQILKNEGLIDGIGLQGHWNINAPSNDLIIAALDKYSSLDLEIHITEMDVSVYPGNSDSESAYTTEMETNQTIAYTRFFNLFRSYNSNISSITFWGLTDSHSWLNNWPVAGRDNYPLLFDSDYNPKKAYFYTIDF